MTGAYLEALDDLLAVGLAGLSPGFRALQSAYLLSAQQADGGFAGRRRTSDTYYTDFALRLLGALPGDPAGEHRPTEQEAEAARAFARAADFLRSARPPRDALECFSVLNAARILAKARITVALQSEAITATLERQRATSGGYTRPGAAQLSTYYSFLAALCLGMVGRPLPAPDRTAAAILALQGPRGGFREQDAAGPEQTNATAAAVGLLTLTDRLQPECARGAAAFLHAMQAPDGGLRAHAEAHGGDLLSTFTGLLTLAGLDQIAAVDLGALGRFVRSCTRPGGGFGASGLDPGADVEYAYYGIGCLALLKAAVTSRRAGL